MRHSIADEGVAELVRLARRSLDAEAPFRDDAGFARLEARLARGRSPRRSRPLAWVGALGATLALATALVLWITLREQALTYHVVNGALVGDGYVVGGAGTRIHFSDGSEVALEPGAETRIRELGAHGGRLELSRGTLRVAIKKVPEAIWTVDAGPYAVRVTGTAFNVSWAQTDQVFELAMQNGSVVVTGPFVGSGVTLRAGQRMRSGVSKGRFTVEDAASAPAAAAATPEPAGPGMFPAPAAPGSELAPELAPAPKVPSNGPPTSAGWSQQVAQGKFQAVLEEAERRGLDQTLATVSLEELGALADAARYARRPQVARRVLLAERQRFPRSARAREAAFFLGRLAEDNGGDALDWYDRYLTESPRGTYASQALGRKMMLVHGRSGGAAARIIATEYLTRYPNGTYAAAARKITGE